VQRAAYLGEQLERAVAGALTPYGRRFVAWLVGALERLDPGARSSWALPADPERTVRPTGDHTPDGLLRAGVRLRALHPVDVVPLPHQGRLVVASVSDMRLRWLNLDSWLIYALCDGRDARSLEREYGRRAPSAVDPADRHRRLRLGLEQLVGQGLVRAEA
jgi:hypothetical protein